MHAVSEEYFFGYDMESPAYLIYFPEKDDVKQVRCVKFSENFECSNDDIIDVPEEYSYSRSDEEKQPQIEKSKEDADKRKDEESRYPQRDRNKRWMTKCQMLQGVLLTIAIALLTFQ